MRGLTPFVALTLCACAPRIAPTPPTPTASAAVSPPSAEPAPAPLRWPRGREDPALLTAVTSRYARPVLATDVSGLPASELAALDAIIAAARTLDPIFERQVWEGNSELKRQLQDTERPFYNLMRGPWDRQNDMRPLLTLDAHPAGAGFYPADITADELESYLAGHESDRAAFESPFSMVVRRDGKLSAIPYSQFFADDLALAAQQLRKAATFTENASLKKFLETRAQAFSSDDYYQSDKDWMDLNSKVEVTIGPYETYEDGLFGRKASFEAFVTISDPRASAMLDKFKMHLPAMERNLPVPAHMRSKRGGESPIRVADLVFTSGDARRSVQTIAFNLPNDERVRKEKGAKKVLLRNVIESKFDQILRPIAERTLATSQQTYLSAEAFFQSVLFHELSHTLGPAFVENDESKGEVRKALGARFAAIEECKADVAGVYNLLFMLQKKQFPKSFREQLLVSAFTGLFRSVRFGIGEAHGQGAAVQINRFIEGGGASWDAKEGRFTVDFAKLEAANRALLTELLTLEHNGNEAAAQAFLARYGVMSDVMTQALAKIEDVPVDISPMFQLIRKQGNPPLRGTFTLKGNFQTGQDFDLETGQVAVEESPNDGWKAGDIHFNRNRILTLIARDGQPWFCKRAGTFAKVDDIPTDTRDCEWRRMIDMGQAYDHRETSENVGDGWLLRPDNGRLYRLRIAANSVAQLATGTFEVAEVRD